jgi:hypothetical protein
LCAHQHLHVRTATTCQQASHGKAPAGTAAILMCCAAFSACS